MYIYTHVGVGVGGVQGLSHNDVLNNEIGFSFYIWFSIEFMVNLPTSEITMFIKAH